MLIKIQDWEIRSKNITLMYVANFSRGILFFLPVLALYLKEELFSITNVTVIFAVEAIAITIFEIPTGAIADLFGRKRSLVLAYGLTLISFIFLYIGRSMTILLIFAALHAFARALNSGSDSALIFDSLKQEARENYYKKVIGVYRALWPLGASISAIVGGHLAEKSLRLPIVITFIPIFAAIVAILFIREPVYAKEENKNVLYHMLNSGKLIIKNKQLLILLAIAFIAIGFGETFHKLRPLFYEFKKIKIIYFGYISALVFGLSSLGYYLSHSVSEKIGNKLTLILTVIFSSLIIIRATFLLGLSAVLLLILPPLFHGLRSPIFDYLLNKEVESNKRATVISTFNFMGRLGVAFFAPFIVLIPPSELLAQEY